MKKTILLFFILLIALTACNSKHKKNTSNIITVSILPQKYFVEQIVGNSYNINVLIPPGASPVTYEPTAKQMADVANSELYFKIGQIEFEKIWTKKIAENNPELQIVDVSSNIDFIAGSCSHHGHNHSHKHSHKDILDPHIWMSPKFVKTIAKNISSAMQKKESPHMEVYSKNYIDFVNEIDSIDYYIKNKLQNIENRNFMIFHPALSYFAIDYNLNQIPIEIEGKAPSPAHIKSIIDEAKQNEIKVIFIQKQFDREKAETIAKEIGAEVVQIDPLAYDWKKSIIDITDKLYEALNK